MYVVRIELALLIVKEKYNDCLQKFGSSLTFLVYTFSVKVNFIKVYLMNIHCRIRGKANKESTANERLLLNV